MANFIQVVRIFEPTARPTATSNGAELNSIDILLNLDHVQYAKIKTYFDPAEGRTVDGTQLTMADGKTILVGDSYARIADFLHRSGVAGG